MVAVVELTVKEQEAFVSLEWIFYLLSVQTEEALKKAGVDEKTIEIELTKPNEIQAIANIVARRKGVKEPKPADFVSRLTVDSIAAIKNDYTKIYGELNELAWRKTRENTPQGVDPTEHACHGALIRHALLQCLQSGRKRLENDIFPIIERKQAELEALGAYSGKIYC